MASAVGAAAASAIEWRVSNRGFSMQDINPITNKIADLRGRLESLRGYL
jgi:hypothetical protein